MVIANEVEGIVRWLTRPECYPNRPDRVEHMETHISHVFLAGSYVYKLKKPVKYDFLDFSTVEMERARGAGMILWVEDGALRARGDRQHEQLAKLLAERKDEGIAALTGGPPQFPATSAGDGCETPANPAITGVSSPEPSPAGWPSRRHEPVQWGQGQSRRLAGNGFAAISPTPVPASILAVQFSLCISCQKGVVLPELRALTGGKCYGCWEGRRT